MGEITSRMPRMSAAASYGNTASAVRFLTRAFRYVLYVCLGKLTVRLWRLQRLRTVVWGSRWEGSWKTPAHDPPVCKPKPNLNQRPLPALFCLKLDNSCYDRYSCGNNCNVVVKLVQEYYCFFTHYISVLYKHFATNDRSTVAMATARRTCRPSTTFVKMNFSQKLPDCRTTSCMHYCHHHQPHHNFMTLDNASTHFSCLNTPHTYRTVTFSHVCYIKTNTSTTQFQSYSSLPKTVFTKTIFMYLYIVRSLYLACILSCHN